MRNAYLNTSGIVAHPRISRIVKRDAADGAARKEGILGDVVPLLVAPHADQTLF